ncbi:MAG: hypothetical protein H6559_02165 [Lewinellaceae bacterium]|nr:hypothetical protein [Lewinellaceae bacterium]
MSKPEAVLGDTGALHETPHPSPENRGGSQEENIVEVIDMDNYRTVLQQEKTDILLEPEVGIVSPIPVE